MRLLKFLLGFTIGWLILNVTLAIWDHYRTPSWLYGTRCHICHRWVDYPHHTTLWDHVWPIGICGVIAWGVVELYRRANGPKG